MQRTEVRFFSLLSGGFIIAIVVNPLEFLQQFKSAILPELKNCQKGTFKPVHGIQFFFC
jgi:hypothetical protein